VRAQVTSVSFFTRASGVADLAQVRYIKAKRTAGGADEQKTYWIATIQYTYAEPSKEPKTRRWNPLGFRIIDFRSEPEVLVEPEAASTPAIMSSAGASGRGAQ
jgi:type IV secretion system protein VirB8